MLKEETGFSAAFSRRELVDPTELSPLTTD